MSIVIIGNGIAGLSAVEEIRKIDRETPIHLVSEEPYLSYVRHKLSNYLVRPLRLEEIYVQPPQWYDDQKVWLYLGLKVTELDTKNKMAILQDGTRLNYEKLILANGSHSFLPPVEGNDKKGVFTVRNYDDILGIQKLARPGKTGLVIGGGLLGLEAAWSLQQGGVNVAVVEYFGRLLPRQLDEEGSAFLQQVAAGAGVRLYLGVEVARILGEDSVRGVELKDGRTIDADLVIFSTGVRPNINIAEGTPLHVNRGIVVNEYMETNTEGVYAAGDVAELEGNVPGIWPVAVDQGKVAGHNAAVSGDFEAGDNTGGAGKTGAAEKIAYREVPPSNTLLVMGTRIFSAGDVNQQSEAFVVKQKDEGKKLYKKLFFREGKMVGAILFGDLKIAPKIKKAMGEGKDMSMVIPGMSFAEVDDLF